MTSILAMVVWSAVAWAQAPGVEAPSMEQMPLEGGGEPAVPVPVDRRGEVARHAAWSERASSEVQVTRRAEIWFPPRARKLEGSHLCQVDVYIDHQGYPIDAVTWDCDEVFHAAAKRSILEWRWSPPEGVARGEGVKVHYELRFRGR
jgi:hypothetical protein